MVETKGSKGNKLLALQSIIRILLARLGNDERLSLETNKLLLDQQLYIKFSFLELAWGECLVKDKPARFK